MDIIFIVLMLAVARKDNEDFAALVEPVAPRAPRYPHRLLRQLQTRERDVTFAGVVVENSRGVSLLVFVVLDNICFAIFISLVTLVARIALVTMQNILFTVKVVHMTGRPTYPIVRYIDVDRPVPHTSRSNACATSPPCNGRLGYFKIHDNGQEHDVDDKGNGAWLQP